MLISFEWNKKMQDTSPGGHIPQICALSQYRFLISCFSIFSINTLYPLEATEINKWVTAPINLPHSSSTVSAGYTLTSRISSIGVSWD